MCCECRRLEHVVRVTAKDVQQTRRLGCSAGFVEPEPACDIGLERRSEAVLGATDEKMQMTPHEPQEAVRLDELRFRERCGSCQSCWAGITGSRPTLSCGHAWTQSRQKVQSRLPALRG